jgi:probable HAF family extracellular repeat protein
VSKTNTVRNRAKRQAGIAAVLAFGTLAALGLAAPASAQYSVTNLGSLGSDSQANALSLTGAAVGFSYLADGNTQRATLTTLGGAIQSLGTLGGANSAATGIATLSTPVTTQIVGYSDIGVGSTQHAFLYTVGGTGGVSGNPQMRDLGTLSGVATDNSLAFGVNSLGQVVGNSINSAGLDVAFRTAVGQTALTASDSLGTLGGTLSTANAVNALGQAVGNANLAGDAAAHAFRTAANGSITAASDLGTLGGTSSSAAAINATGSVVGDSLLAGDTIDHAVVWTQVGTGMQMTDIGTLASGDFSGATGINSLGSVVGFSNLASLGTDTHAFLYQGGTLTDLNSLISPSSGWTLEYASSINDAGQIAGYGLFQGSQRAFLLNPAAAPEPSALAVLALGGLGTAILAARKRRGTPTL